MGGSGPSLLFSWNLRSLFGVYILCRILRVSVAGYYEHFVRCLDIVQRRHLSNEALLVHIRAVHEQNREAYGWPRIWRALRTQGIRVGKLRVQRLMQRNDICVRDKRRFPITTTVCRLRPTSWIATSWWPLPTGCGLAT